MTRCNNLLVMKEITSLKQLEGVLEQNENVWLLLYKKGSEQSDCALGNLEAAAAGSNGEMICTADVVHVRDIHPVYSITSVPALIHFESGRLRSITKGCHQSGQYKAILEKSVYVAAAGDKDKPQKNVVVYTTPTCTWCTTVKRHLQENGIRYREVDVSADQKAAEEMVRRSGQQGVPQTDINGQIVVGFDKTRINTLLGIQ